MEDRKSVEEISGEEIRQLYFSQSVLTLLIENTSYLSAVVIMYFISYFV